MTIIVIHTCLLLKKVPYPYGLNAMASDKRHSDLLNVITFFWHQVNSLAHLSAYFQYNTQHIMPLEDVKLESVEDDGSKYPDLTNNKL